MGTERDFAWGDGHMKQCADDVSLGCTLETCAPIFSIKNNFIKSKNLKNGVRMTGIIKLIHLIYFKSGQ